MNRIRNLSVVGNILLIMMVIWLLRRGPSAPDRSLAAADVQITHPSRVSQAPPFVAAGPSLEPFRWNQLESTDYRAYVANLRRVGCPEQTIRDIIAADLDSAYAPRRAQFERNLTAGLAAHQEAETALQELRNEEAFALATLLGDPLPAQQPAGIRPERVLANRNARPVMPVVFGNIDPATLQLDQAQMAIIDQIRQKFQQELGPQDPGDPTYQQRWNAAQRAADDRLRGRLGSRVYIQCQVQAANQLAREEKSE